LGGSSDPHLTIAGVGFPSFWPAMIAKLIVASGKNAGRSIAIKRNKLLIGRAEQCDVRPLSEDVSRRHCAVTVGPAEVWVEDLGSRNGTYVNNVRIAERTRVADGDLIKVGSLELRVSCTVPAPAFNGSEEDVSRLMMADDEPAGMADTTRTLPGDLDGTGDDAGSSSIHAAGPGEPAGETPAGGSSISGIDAAGKDGSGTGGEADAETSRSSLEALKAANSKPGGLPTAAKKPAADSSRDAAADALRKFFERK